MANISKLNRIKEYAKCVQSPAYYGENYCKVFDQTNGGDVPFKVFPRQREFIENCLKYDFNIVRKPRQTGVSTTAALFVATNAMFEDNRKTLIIANKQDTAHEFLKKVKSFVNYVPKWMGIKVIRETMGLIILNNGSEIKAVATSEDALRGFTPTLLVMDEAAYIDHGENVWTAAQPSLSTGGGAILLSTPNGRDPLYYEIYDAAKNDKNNFHITEFKWFEDPRFNKNLTWTKGDMVIDDWLRRKVVEDDFITFDKLEERGFTPTSSWFVDMCRQLNGDERKIAQEILGSFLGSGDNVIDDQWINIQDKENVKTPIRTEEFDGNMWIWEDPIPDHQYVQSIDVSRGDSADFSTIVIIDVNTGCQVAEYQGMVPGDYLGQMGFKYGNKYQAYTIVDITGGYGIATILKLLDMGFEKRLIHYDHTRSKVLIDRLKGLRKGEKIPGFNISGNNRVLVIQELERQVRQQEFIVRSSRAISEMRTWIYKNGRADHAQGKHDDILMAMGQALFVINTSFKNLKRHNSTTKAMIDSMTSDSTEYKDEITPQTNYNGQTDQLWNTKEYNWLFPGAAR
ncbi:hypothetical protein COB55_05630 [Candidatus Wolfebacteria bacterium]|nr:MAG: hypothetical protein COB55_05630 [Candidatus Wolfebacteria bacterium]